MSSNTPVTVNQPEFWEGLYERGEDGWELGQPAPPLEAYLRRRRPPQGKVAVLGCGRGHDARLFARLGYQVWGLDFSARAIHEARALARGEGLQVAFERRDIFDLAEDYRGRFDGVWEYTCFCAIHPERRGEYVELVRAILKPGGWLLACFFPLREGTDGPPFPASQPEISRLFVPYFSFVEAFAPTESVERRMGLEWMILAHRRAASVDPPLDRPAGP